MLSAASGIWCSCLACCVIVFCFSLIDLTRCHPYIQLWNYNKTNGVQEFFFNEHETCDGNCTYSVIGLAWYIFSSPFFIYTHKHTHLILIMLLIIFLNAVSAVKDNVAEQRHAEMGEKRAGVCLTVPCKDSSFCDEICKDGKYRGGLCLPPSNNCCCLY